MNKIVNFKDFILILEERGSSISVRTVVRDIINIVKSGKKGTYVLPNDRNTQFKEYITPTDKTYKSTKAKHNINYSFDNLPVEFSVKLVIKHDEKLDGFRVGASTDKYIVYVDITLNPGSEINWYELSGELNVDIAHEIEHILQYQFDEFDDYDRDYNTNYEYYMLEDEVPAQIQGFKRLYDIERKRNKSVRFEDLVRNWFIKNRYISKLSIEDEERIISNITSMAKVKYPNIN